ncbi:hypothetical protein ACIRPK_17275 [Kitasatospora sp. NPDC101801]|uniref:hypothetical protein n=1 Tax=Kitasatospora sp. NPDC101801 TaxID=3364103 RepID=UPI003801DE6D
MVSAPNLPSGGSMVVEYSRLLESAHRIGRALHDLDDQALTDAIRVEAERELTAAESAELGDLTGRAQQAVLLSREDASPVQVAAADQLLNEDPFGPDELFSAIDPTAAAVAAAHWLASAAEVAAETSGEDPTLVVRSADDIEALPHRTPTVVLGRILDDDDTPKEAVTELVRHAMHITDGLYLDPATLQEQLDDLEENIAEYTGEDDPDMANIALRLTPLDPKRPARDLLEDLLIGIHGCWLIHSESADLEEDEDLGDAEEWDDEQAEEHSRRSRARFSELVRQTAAANRDRLS